MKYFTDEYYHIYNRGVDKRTIYTNSAEYMRFLFILDAFNSSGKYYNISDQMIHPTRSTTSSKNSKLVEVVDYCLMPNHFHLILRQLQEGGISRFTQKIGVGYTHYFNLKHRRSGVLLQGRTKSKHIDQSNYMNYLIEYLYLNPVDLIEPGWKENGVKNIDGIINFLEQYKWSSCNDPKLLYDYFTRSTTSSKK